MVALAALSRLNRVLRGEWVWIVIVQIVLLLLRRFSICVPVVARALGSAQIIPFSIRAFAGNGTKPKGFSHPRGEGFPKVLLVRNERQRCLKRKTESYIQPGHRQAIDFRDLEAKRKRIFLPITHHQRRGGWEDVPKRKAFHPSF